MPADVVADAGVHCALCGVVEIGDPHEFTAIMDQRPFITGPAVSSLRFAVYWQSDPCTAAHHGRRNVLSAKIDADKNGRPGSRDGIPAKDDDDRDACHVWIYFLCDAIRARALLAYQYDHYDLLPVLS